MRSIVSALIIVACTAPACAQTIELHRGIATDTWVNWPNEDVLNEKPDFLKDFPGYRQTATLEHIAKIKKAGFDFVRLGLDPIAYLWRRSPEKSQRLNAQLASAISDFRMAGLKVVVDFHAVPKSDWRIHGTETYLADDASFATFTEEVVGIARAVAEEDPEATSTAFEPFNEPNIDCDYEQTETNRWPAMALKLHKAVRAAAPKTTLVMSGACWGGADGLAVLNPKDFNDDNIIWSFHNYHPFIFTHQSATWVDGAERYIANLHYPAKKSEKKKVIAATLAAIRKSELSNDEKERLFVQANSDLEYYFDGGGLKLLNEGFEKVDAWAKKHGILPSQIFLGEFGANRPDKPDAKFEASRVAFHRDMRKAAEKYGYAWSLWNWGAGMGITDGDTSRNFSPDQLQALGLKQ